MEMVVNNVDVCMLDITSKELPFHYQVFNVRAMKVTLLAFLLTVKDIVKGVGSCSSCHSNYL